MSGVPLKKVLITGIGGQDGSYLAQHLLDEGCEVHGIELPAAIKAGLENLSGISDRLYVHSGSLGDETWINRVVEQIQPHECYHLAANSFVSFRSKDERLVLNNNIGGTHALLEAVRNSAGDCRLFFAGTSEMFGSVDRAPQNEKFPFRPRSIYGISKVAGHHLVDYYRREHGLFACTGIFFNHESPRRGQHFVTRKITFTLVRILLGIEKELSLGNLDMRRDWGYAPEYVVAARKMLSQDSPEDFVIATGQTHSVRDFIDAAAAFLGIKIQWNGKGVKEEGRVLSWDSTALLHIFPEIHFPPRIRPGDRIVAINPQFFRPAEAVPLVGDISKISTFLHWTPAASFEEIVSMMVQSDLERFLFCNPDFFSLGR